MIDIPRPDERPPRALGIVAYRRVAYVHMVGRRAMGRSFVLLAGLLRCDAVRDGRYCDAQIWSGQEFTIGAPSRAAERPGPGKRLVYCRRCRPFHPRDNPPNGCGYCVPKAGPVPYPHKRSRPPRPRSVASLKLEAYRLLARVLLTHACSDDPGCRMRRRDGLVRSCVYLRALAELVG